jgi:peptidoglycan-associated lipoprotein
MHRSFLHFLALGLVLASLTACGSRVRLYDEKNAAVPYEQGQVASQGDAAQSKSANTGGPSNSQSLGAAANSAAKAPNGSVYFDFDSSVVTDKYNDLIAAYAQYLKTNPNQRVTLEGNTDERGDSEYNLALGARRAESVSKGLSALGIAQNRLSTVSFGKEKPRAEGHNEAAWAQNRRVDFNLGR